MVQAEYFDKIEAVAKYIKKSQLPFGGIQLIICGDFLQLPPVFKDPKVKKKFCFQVCLRSLFHSLLNKADLVKNSTSKAWLRVMSVEFRWCFGELIMI